MWVGKLVSMHTHSHKASMVFFQSSKTKSKRKIWVQDELENRFFTLKLTEYLVTRNEGKKTFRKTQNKPKKYTNKVGWYASEGNIKYTKSHAHICYAVVAMWYRRCTDGILYIYLHSYIMHPSWLHTCWHAISQTTFCTFWVQSIR